MSSIGPDLAARLGGAGPPPNAGSAPGAVTSDHTTGNLDFIRTAILSLQHFAEITTDDVELARVHKCIAGLQSILADHAQGKDKALGMTPALQHVRRSTQGYWMALIEQWEQTVAPRGVTRWHAGHLR